MTETPAMSPVTDLISCLQAFWPHQKFTGEQIAAILDSRRFSRFDVAKVRAAVATYFSENPDQRGPNWSAIADLLWGEQTKARKASGFGGELVGWFRASKEPECRELLEAYGANRIDVSVLEVWRRGRDAVAFHQAYRGSLGLKWQTPEEIDAGIAQLRKAVEISRTEYEGRRWLDRIASLEQSQQKRRESLRALYAKVAALPVVGQQTNQYRERILGLIRQDAMAGGCYAEVCGANLDGTVYDNNEHPF